MQICFIMKPLSSRTEKIWPKKPKHSTAKQAAQIAKEANVKQLVLGHYSGRYKDDMQRLKQRRQEVFNNTRMSQKQEKFLL